MGVGQGLDCEGRRRCRVPALEAPFEAVDSGGDVERHLHGELQVRELRLLREPRSHQPQGGGNIPREHRRLQTSLNYLGKEKDYGNEPWGEDLFAQRCMDLHGVDKVSVFDLTTDGMCEAFRPEGQKKNKKWTPDCATTTTAGMHPFKNPKVFFDCLKATQR